MDRGAWQATVSGIVKSRSQLHMYTHVFLYLLGFLSEVYHLITRILNM